MNLLRLIFLTSAFGAVPVALRVGYVSLSAVFTILIFGFAIFSWLLNPRIRTSSLPVIVPLLIFFVLSLVWYVVLEDITSGELVNYPFVWGGVLFIIMAASALKVNDVNTIKKTHCLINRLSYLYVAVLGVISIFRTEDPASTQVGMIFFAFHVLRLLSLNKYRSIIPLVLILFLQTLLLSRIVVAAELVMFFFALKFTNKLTLSRVAVYKMIFIGLALLVVFALILYSSGMAQKTEGGDQAIEIGGVWINTSGRWYWWDITFQSAIKSLFFGHGVPIPDEMIGVEGWSHPHNDYLRIFHQMGMLGVILWILFVYAVFQIAFKMSQRTLFAEVRFHSYLVIFSLIGVSISMITDNTIVYSYVMFPISALIGVQLAIGGPLTDRGKTLPHKTNR